MTAPVSLTPDQEAAARRVDDLDLAPVASGLMHPYPGLTVMGTAEADQVVAAYRRWLKLCAWYPDEPIVPSLAVDDAWMAHVTDTARYAQDCAYAFGRFAHARPYHGPNGGAGWRAAYERTRALFRAHFGTDMPGGPAARAPGHPEEADCCRGGAGRGGPGSSPTPLPLEAVPVPLPGMRGPGARAALAPALPVRVHAGPGHAARSFSHPRHTTEASPCHQYRP